MSAPEPSTIREHAEWIATQSVGGDPLGWIVDATMHAQAILDALDKARIHEPMMMGTGMGDIEFVDDVYTPEGADLYRAANRHRLVPDPRREPSTKDDT